MSAPTFFVTAATGTADLLAAELAALGIADAREVLGGVSSAAPLPDAYRACLWSRVGLRVLWRIAEFPVAGADDLYRRLREIDWSAHMDVGDTLAVDFSGSVAGISHTTGSAHHTAVSTRATPTPPMTAAGSEPRRSASAATALVGCG